MRKIQGKAEQSANVPALEAMIVWLLAGIASLRDTTKSYGVHSRYTGIAGAFAERFGEPLYTVQRDAKGNFVGIAGPLESMSQTGRIAYRSVRGGYMLYDGREYAASQQQREQRQQQQQRDKNKALAARIDSAAAARQQ